MKLSSVSNGYFCIEANPKLSGDWEKVKKVAEMFFSLDEGYAGGEENEAEQYITVCFGHPHQGAADEHRDYFKDFKKKANQ